MHLTLSIKFASCLKKHFTSLTVFTLHITHYTILMTHCIHSAISHKTFGIGHVAWLRCACLHCCVLPCNLCIVIFYDTIVHNTVLYDTFSTHFMMPISIRQDTLHIPHCLLCIVSTCDLLAALVMLHACARSCPRVCVTSQFVVAAIWAKIDLSSAKGALRVLGAR